MRTKGISYRLQLFTLRLWPELLDGEAWEWRGEVKNTSIGETRYFRDLCVLSDFLSKRLEEQLDIPAEQSLDADTQEDGFGHVISDNEE